MATAIPKNHAEVTTISAAAVTGGVVLRGGGKRARGIVSDTRAVRGGEAFVALRGEHHDAHAFLHDAVERGAALLVVDQEPTTSMGGTSTGLEAPDVVRVPNTLSAWGDLARAHVDAWRKQSDSASVIAITGSAGKTTTKQLCAALLAEIEPTYASPGNLNNLVGVPAVLFALEPTHRLAVVECGMSVRGEIARLASIVRADVAVITNVSVAHAEGVGGTREDVAREKGALFDALGPNGVCVFDADDATCRALAERSVAKRKIGFGRSGEASYRLVERASLGRDGSRVIVAREGTASEIGLPFVGDAAAIDLCAALAAAEAAVGQIPDDAIARAMSRVRNVDGRAQLVDVGRGVLLVDDSYNANPASMVAAFSLVVDLAQGTNVSKRCVAVLGEMKELGERARAEHTALGDRLADVGVALVIGCGGLASEIVSRAHARGVEAVDCVSVDAAVEVALDRIRDDDVVLVKGSRSVGMERVVLALKRGKP